MKRFLIGMMCAGILLMTGVINTNAAPKKKAEAKEPVDMQCREITLIGVISEERESKPKNEKKAPTKYRVLIDNDKKEWHLPRPQNIPESVNIKDFEGQKVKITGMIVGKNTGLTSIKTIEKVGN
jgi:hypothetical protein